MQPASRTGLTCMLPGALPLHCTEVNGASQPRWHAELHGGCVPMGTSGTQLQKRCGLKSPPALLRETTIFSTYLNELMFIDMGGCGAQGAWTGDFFLSTIIINLYLLYTSAY